jgi:hypothetical protein
MQLWTSRISFLRILPSFWETICFFLRKKKFIKAEKGFVRAGISLHIWLIYLISRHYTAFFVDNSGFIVMHLNWKWKLNLIELFVKVQKEINFGCKSELLGQKITLNIANNL